jgi:hypothetical protein
MRKAPTFCQYITVTKAADSAAVLLHQRRCQPDSNVEVCKASSTVCDPRRHGEAKKSSLERVFVSHFLLSGQEEKARYYLGCLIR